LLVTASDPARLSPELADLPPVLKVPEVASHLRCDPATIYELIRRGELEVVKLGRAFRITREALTRFVEGE
jgi:excisionase family DNA binding protein